MLVDPAGGRVSSGGGKWTLLRPATGRAFLKTGSLLDVRAIAGYVRGAGGRVYAVSALINHPDAPAATKLLDALVEWVAVSR